MFMIYAAYTKLAVILWTKELQKRIDAEGAPIIAIALHPGNVSTSADKLPPSWRAFGSLVMKLFFKPAEKGAYTSVIAAASPEVKKKPDAYKGSYLEPLEKIATPSKPACNTELSKELWTTTEVFLTNIGLNAST